MSRDYSQASDDRLLEHYAVQYARSRSVSLLTAREVVDTSPNLQHLLGRTTSTIDTCAYERACVLAGIATEEDIAKVQMSLEPESSVPHE